MTRIALIGLGRWGQEHLRVLRALGVEVFGCDVRPECLERVAAFMPRDHLSSDAESLLERVDAVDVVAPAPEHFALCRAALDAGKDVFVEKPMTATLEEARELRQRVHAARTRLQVGHVFRFHPVYDALRAALAAGRVGHARYLAGRFAGLKRPRTDGGVTHSDAIHFADLCTDLLGRPRGVTATVRDFLGRGMDDFSVAVIEFERQLAVIESGYFAPRTWRELQVVGDQGCCVADFTEWTLTFHPGHHRKAGAAWEVEPASLVVEVVERQEALHRELRAFVDGIATGKPPLVDADAGYRALVLVEAIHAASILERRVSIEEVERAGAAT